MFPLLHNCLNAKDILNSRLVCRKWKREIDTFLERGSSSFHAGLPRSSIFGEITLTDLLTVTQFNKAFEDENSKDKTVTLFTDDDNRLPFISRSLTLGSCTSDEELETAEFWEQAELTLATHGEKLWHLRLHFCRDLDDYLQFIVLTDLLKLTPNLRSLEILCSPEGNGRSLGLEINWEGSRFQLPELPRLELLRTENIDNVRLKSLLEKYSHIHRLQWSTVHAPPENFKGDTIFPNLYFYEALSDDCFHFTGEQCPNVEMLHIRYDNLDTIQDPTSTSNMKVALENVNAFGKSVRYLLLHLQPPRFGSILKMDCSVVGRSVVWMNLPHLEILHLSLYQVDLNNIDFLLLCRSLEAIVFRYFEDQDIAEPVDTDAGGPGSNP